jgi:hypothetical protein
MAEVKRGYRKVTAIIPVNVYEALVQQANREDREPGQQVAFLLKRFLTLPPKHPEQGPGIVDEFDANGVWEDSLEHTGVEVEPAPAEVE